MTQIKHFCSPIDDCCFEYKIVDGNLSYKIQDCDWQDFILEDKRAYTDEEYAEFLSLLEDNQMPQIRAFSQLDLLSDCLEDFCTKHNLEFMSADDILYGSSDGELTNYQKDWLRNYIEVWDTIANL